MTDAATVTLKRASKSRSGGPWDDDDYDMFAGGRHIGRIIRHPQAPQGRPWFWTITARVPQYPHDRDYAAPQSVGASCGSFEDTEPATDGVQTCSNCFAVLFYLWAIPGLIVHIFVILDPGGLISSSVSVSGSLAWIGGMVLFGTPAMLCAAWRMLPDYSTGPRPSPHK